MSLLFKHLRVHQVFGANTDVGKTVLTSALIRASASKQTAVFYLKPVSTGPTQDADDELRCYILLNTVYSFFFSFFFPHRYVKRYAGTRRDLVHTECLFRFGEPVSPHLAAKLALEASDGKVRTQFILKSCVLTLF